MYHFKLIFAALLLAFPLINCMKVSEVVPVAPAPEQQPSEAPDEPVLPTEEDDVEDADPELSNDLPPIVQDPCEGVDYSESRLRELASLKVTPEVIFPGESVVVTWKTKDPNVKSLMSGGLNSEESSGSKKITLTESSVFTLTSSACGSSVIQSETVTVKSFVKMDVENISLISKGSGESFWAAQGASLLYSERLEKGFSLRSSSRMGMFYKDENYQDDSSITAILEMNSGCPGVVFYGTEGGYLYRSHDGGVHSDNLQGQDYALAYFTTNPDDVMNNPSAVHFIIQDPQNSKRVIVGHEDGLTAIDDCEAADITALKNIDESNSSISFSHKNLLFSQAYKNKIYMAAEDGIYITDNFSDWNLISLDKEARWLHASHGKIYFGDDDGVWTLDEDQKNIYLDEIGNDLVGVDNFIFLATEDGVLMKQTGQFDWILLAGPKNVEAMLITKSFSFHQQLLLLDQDGDLYRMSLGNFSKNKFW